MTSLNQTIRNFVHRRQCGGLPAVPRSRRQGFSLIELLAASALLAVMVVVMLPFLAALANAREAIAHRELALHELQNLVELTQLGGDPSVLTLSAAAQQILPDAELTVTAEDSAAQPATMRQQTFALSWINHAGIRTSPLTLSCWSVVTAEGER